MVENLERRLAGKKSLDNLQIFKRRHRAINLLKRIPNNKGKLWAKH